MAQYLFVNTIPQHKLNHSMILTQLKIALRYYFDARYDETPTKLKQNHGKSADKEEREDITNI